MLEVDDTQDFVWELIDEVLDSSFRNITENYLERQKIPYNINEAKKAILHIIDVNKNNNVSKIHVARFMISYS